MLEWITNIMDSLGYMGVVLLMFLENIFPPIPSEVVMPLAGFTAKQGKLNLVFVVLAGMVGSVLGALPWYFAGKYFGEDRLKHWADRYGKWLTLSSEEIDKANRWFDKQGGKAVFFCRLVPGVRTLISVPAGIGGMNLVPFLLYSALGTLLWTGALAYAGYLLGKNYRAVEKYLGPAAIIAIAVLVVAFAVWVVKRKKHSSKKRRHR